MINFFVYKAAKRGHHEISSILIDRGIDIYARDAFTDNSLHLASIYDHKEIAEQLLKAHQTKQEQLLLELKVAYKKKELDSNLDSTILNKLVQENKSFKDLDNDYVNSKKSLHICKIIKF